MNNDESTQFTIVKSTSDQTMQLFKDYKLILHEAIEALRIVKEQENIEPIGRLDFDMIIDGVGKRDGE
ncbi:hypothetical protein GLOIN_2v1879806 [Rhizophagus irregularis DAOM 181602=DAOM 197198]|nr:hypothetical protein GLOIN_2v1879806 [Rhizophagus irregularis DAOM 181602=DAOM 197198]